jgi:hypothetical protein
MMLIATVGAITTGGAFRTGGAITTGGAAITTGGVNQRHQFRQHLVLHPSRLTAEF